MRRNWRTRQQRKRIKKIKDLIIQPRFAEYKYHAVLQRTGNTGFLQLTYQLAGFPAPIPFRFAYFCHVNPVNKYPRDLFARTSQFSVLDNKSLIHETFCCVVSLRIFTRCLYLDSLYGFAKMSLVLLVFQCQFNKLTSVFHASVLLLIMNFISLSK